MKSIQLRTNKTFLFKDMEITYQNLALNIEYFYDTFCFVTGLSINDNMKFVNYLSNSDQTDINLNDALKQFIKEKAN